MKRVDTSRAKIQDFLSRGTEHIIVKEHLLSALRSGESLRVKHGVDPTTVGLHLGHGAVYLKLRDLQEMGHKIVFLVGDFTARFGDPTDKAEARTLRSKDDVEEAAQSYLEQVGMILDRSRIEIRRNAEWYDAMSAEELLRLISRFSVDQLLERDMFKVRRKAHKPIWFHEPAYPVLQGYDSVMLRSDLTVVGTDQIFNESRGRDLQSAWGQEPQDIVAMSLLVGTDGSQKMSQSLGNHIALTDSPHDKFGKIMSIPDKCIIQYYTLSTRVPLDEIDRIEQNLAAGSLHPRDAKLSLAQEIVSLYHSPAEASAAREEFVRTFSKKESPQHVDTKPHSARSDTLLSIVVATGLTQSRSEARRLIEAGAVEVEGVTKTNPLEEIDLSKNPLLRIGKARFIRIAAP